LAVVILATVSTPALAQNPSVQRSLEKTRVNCPGDPPGNLASIDCNFTPALRFEELVSNGLTDGAMLGAGFWGLVAHLRQEPEEWERSWQGFGKRVGTRYAQNLAKSLTAYGVGALLRDDPRHVSYAADPGLTSRRSGVAPRIGHAVLDWATVRRSTHDGNGKRIPNVGLVAASSVSGLIGNTWYPERLRSRTEVGKRIASSLSTAMIASFYTEFSPELGRALGRIVGRRRQPGLAP